MEGWHRKCSCGCSTPGIPCRGYAPVKPGDYGGHRGLITPQPYTAPSLRINSAGDYGGHRGLITPQPYTATPQRINSAGDDEPHRGLPMPQPCTAPPQPNNSAGDYGGYRGLPMPQPCTAPPQPNNSAGDDEPHKGLPMPQPCTAPPQPNNSAGDYGGYRGLITPQPYTAPPHPNNSAGDDEPHRGLIMAQPYTAPTAPPQPNNSAGDNEGPRGLPGLPIPQPYTSPPQRHNSGYGWIPPSHCMGTFRWQTCFGGSVPADAVHAGTDLNGAPIYVGRSFHCGDLLPAKVTPAHGCAYISYAGTEITKQDYEVLCSNHVAWKFCEGGAVPPEAIRIGNTSDGEHLFMGRTMVEGTLTPGKVHPSHGCLYVPFDGRELSFPTYEVLVLS